MGAEEEIINRVATSSLVTFDLEKYYTAGDRVLLDIRDQLYEGLILKEKDFREALRSLDWEPYRSKNVALTCSADAIIPVWAWMLAVSYLQPVAKDVVMGDINELQKRIFLKNIEGLKIEEFADKRVVVKGCGEVTIEPYAYAEITRRLRPVVKSIMYGEPCSTVPIYKKK